MKPNILARSFSTREKALMLVLVIVLLVAAYYYLVVRNVADTQEANALALEEVQGDIDVQLAVAQTRAKMEAELAELGTLSGLPQVAVYDNLRNELDELNRILGRTDSYDIKFSAPELDGETVRRAVSITFAMPTYEESLAVVGQLQNGEYRCDVTDFALTGSLAADGSVKSVSATLKVTYFETVSGAESLNGLIDNEKSAVK